MANYSLGKISKQPFPPTIFYDTLKAIIYTFHSTFLSEMVTVWKVATSIIKWYFRLGVSSRIKNVFCSQSKIKSEVFTKLQTGLVQGGQGTSVLRDHLFCSRPIPRLVLISIFFQDQYQDLSWFQFSFKTNTKTSLEMDIFSRPIPRLVLILETIQDQYQESWL